MPRTVYLVVYNSPLFPAHWGLWIPQLDNPDVGKFIEAAGDAANGFDISFERNYDLGSTPRAYRKLPLADVLVQYVGARARTRLRMIASRRLRLAFLRQAGVWFRSLRRYVALDQCQSCSLVGTNGDACRDQGSELRYRIVRRGCETWWLRLCRRGSWIRHLLRLSTVLRRTEGE
jgi:hypothetical protein